ncbi:TetR/AcrR family transcriptional regulator [Amycolatopsis sp. NPDC004378]
MTIKKPARAPRRDGQRTRAAILTAAADLFARHGFTATTLKTIGDVAGCDPALVNRYFGSKAELLVQIVRQQPDLLGQVELFESVPPSLWGRALVARHMVASGAPGAGEALTNMFRTMLRSIDSPGSLSSVADVLGERYATVVSRHLEGPDAELRALLVEAVMSGFLLLHDVERAAGLRRAEPERIQWYLGSALQTLLTPAGDRARRTGQGVPR